MEESFEVNDDLIDKKVKEINEMHTKNVNDSLKRLN